ncbi:HAMP domain-containing protein, partial [Candidatus Allofournierella merdipullorum]|uniref:HAMP domain-containing protein n=1 Tax=Candidatus Allofournierella merdipullorum TaxID=2838595 RepID=UPI00374F1F1D
MYFSTTAALLIVSTAVLCAIQMYLVMGYFKQDKKESLSEVASIVTTQIHLRQQTENSMDIDPALAQKIQESMALVSETSSTIILFTDENGVVQLCSEGTSSSNVGRQVPANILADLTADGSFFETGTLGGIYPSACYTVGGIVDDGGLPLGYVFASTSAGSLNIFVGDMFSSFVLAAGLMLLASSVLAIFFTTRLTTPLRRISEAARKFGGGDFSVRVPVDGDDEVAQLAVTFNNMA